MFFSRVGKLFVLIGVSRMNMPHVNGPPHVRTIIYAPKNGIKVLLYKSMAGRFFQTADPGSISKIPKKVVYVAELG